MNNEGIKEETIAGYILGDLPDDQTTSLDELAVADHEFFERIGVVENHLVDRYVRGGLNEAELASFESHYVKSPLRREKIQLARAFLEFAEANVTLPAVADRSKAETNGWLAGFFAAFGFSGGVQPVFRFALVAAALIVVGIVGMMVFRNLSGTSRDEIASNIGSNQSVPDPRPSPSVNVVEVNTNPSPTPRPEPSPTSTPSNPKPSQPLIASFVLGPPLRGGNVKTLTIPSTVERVDIRLQIESDDFRSYSVALTEAVGGQVMWRAARLTAVGSPSSRLLRINIPANTLRPSVYTVSVSGRTESGQLEAVGDYPFRVVR